MTKTSFLKLIIGVSIAGALYSLQQVGSTMGYDAARAKLFFVMLLIAVVIGLVASIMLAYFKATERNSNPDALAVETLAQLGEKRQSSRDDHYNR